MSKLVSLIANTILWLRARWLGEDVREPQPRRDLLRDWKRAVDRCGLRVAGEIPEVCEQLTARAGPVAVQLQTFGQGTRIVIEAPVAPDFEPVKIRSAFGRPQLGKVRIGDPAFDEAFSIEGPTPQLFALLDADIRRRMCAVDATGRLDVSEGRIVAMVVGDGWVSDVLPSLLYIGRRLGAPAAIPRSLVENVKRDSEGGVRLQNLLLLLREMPGDPATAEALRAACSDGSPATRLRAARELGAEGRDALLKLAQSLDDDDVSAEAVSILDRELPLDRAKAILDRAWSTGRLKTALACVKALGRSGADAVGPLAEVLAGQNVKLAVAAVRALEATGSPDAEPLLIQALRHEEADVQLAAARALGRAGSAAAVLPLKEAAEGSGLDLGLRQAARQAVAEIQSRAEGASPGQLSLAGTEAGQLSLAQEGGELSLAQGERDVPGE